MATFNAYKTFQGWIITACKDGRTMYLQTVHNGEYRFCRDSLYAKTVSAKTAGKHLSDLIGIKIMVEDRSSKMPWVISEMIKKGWNKDEAFMIADRIFRQYENNVMGLSVQAMVNRQITKAEWETENF